MTAEEARKLFVAGLPDSFDETVLRQLFESTGGTVVEVSMPRDRATGRPRGFGFVTLATEKEALAVRNTLDGSFQGGKPISVRPFQSEPPKRGPGAGPPPARGGGGGGAGGVSQERTMYVGNLPYDTSQEELEGMLYGASVSNFVRVTLPTDDSGRKRGFGFVTLATLDDANAAMEALRGVTLRGRELVVNLAHPKGERSRDEGGGASAAPARTAPRTFESAPAPAAAKRNEKRRGGGEAAGRRSKAWDREREGRSATWDDDWDDDDRRR